MPLTCMESKQYKKELEEKIINTVKQSINNRIRNFIVEKDTRYTYDVTCMESKQYKKELEEEIINIVKQSIIDRIRNFIVEKDTYYTRYKYDGTCTYDVTSIISHIKYTNNTVFYNYNKFKS